jgi:hypothetical protein
MDSHQFRYNVASCNIELTLAEDHILQLQKFLTMYGFNQKLIDAICPHESLKISEYLVAAMMMPKNVSKNNVEGMEFFLKKIMNSYKERSDYDDFESAVALCHEYTTKYAS